MRRLTLVIVSIAALAIASCGGASRENDGGSDSGGGGGNGVSIGVIHHESQQPVITYPSIVRNNVPFVITVHTYGDSCVSFERDDVALTDSGGQITPYDRRVDQGSCSGSVDLIPHVISAMFRTPGTKIITVNGRRITGSQDQPITATVNVLIQ